jgi:hypothetical protein
MGSGQLPLPTENNLAELGPLITPDWVPVSELECNALERDPKFASAGTPSKVPRPDTV